MKSKKHNLIFGIIGMVVISIFIFYAFTKFILPMYENNDSQVIEIQNINQKEIILKKKPEQRNIFGIEIEIAPNTRSNYTVTISNNKGVLYETKVKQGKEYIYKSDWYDSICSLSYTPDIQSKDLIKIEYRFLGKN